MDLEIFFQTRGFFPTRIFPATEDFCESQPVDQESKKSLCFHQVSGRTKHYSHPSKHNKKLPYCTIKIIFAETFLRSTHIFFTKKNKKMARKKVCLQGNIPAGKYSRGFRKNNKNSRVFPHKNISLYSINKKRCMKTEKKKKKDQKRKEKMKRYNIIVGI